MARRFACSGLVLVITALMAAPAWAHVSVSPAEAPRGGFTTLTFQVPNETDDATTTKVEVQFPQDHPISTASVRALPGWTIAVTNKQLDPPITTAHGETVGEAVNTVTWTAAAGKGIAPGYFEQFQVSVGLPDEGDVLAFPALQTYSDGEVVSWIQRETEDGAEPENPAPTLTLTEAGDDHHGTDTTEPGDTSDTSDSAAEHEESESSDDSNDTLAIVAIVVGGAALLVSFGAIAASRRRTAS